MQLIYLFTLFLAIVCNSFLSILLWRKTRPSIATISFIILLFSITIWAIPIFIINSFSLSSSVYESFSRFSALGYIALPVVFLVFTLSHTNSTGLLNRYFFWLFLFFTTIFFLFLSWTTELIEVHTYSSVIQTEWGIATRVGSLFPLFLVWFDSVMIYGFYLLFILYRNSSDRIVRRQTRIFIVAVAIPLVIGTLTDAILPMLDIFIFPLAIPLTSIMGILIVYAMLTYGLFVIDASTILRSVGEGVVTVDRTGEVILMNATARKLLQYSDENKEHSIYRLVPFINKKGKKLSLKQHPIFIALGKGKSMHTSQYSIATLKKTVFPASVTVTPVILEGRRRGATIIIRDITAEKEIEYRKDAFISIASHELKTPITSMKLYAQLLKKELQMTKNNRVKTYMTQIERQLLRITQMVNDLLDVSKLQQKNLDLHLTKTDIGMVTKQTVEVMQSIHADYRILFEGETHLNIWVDPYRIEQVLVNLISNAVKYSPHHSDITVRLEKKKNEVIVSVCDSGTGIAKKQMRNIFERFYRTDEAHKSNIPGMGIGLYIASEIIKRHKGKIWVKNNKEKGATFYVSLPIVSPLLRWKRKL